MKRFLSIFLVLIMFFTLSACADKPISDAASSSTESETLLTTQDPEDVDEIKVIDAASFNGTWEGVLGEPLGYKVILDCATDVTPRKVTVSIIADTWNRHYIEAYHKVEDGVLTVLWNDEANRATMELYFTNENEIHGTYSQYGNTVSAECIKVSDTATREPFQIKLQENLMNLLAENNDFDRPDSIPVHFGYVMEDPKLDELREAYGLAEIAGEGDTQTKALNLLNWVGSHTNHNGSYDSPVKNALAVLEYAYDKGHQNGVNCHDLSIILTEACLAMGIQARSLWLYPADSSDIDRHVITMAYIPENEKWIMLDPSSNCYLSDMDGNILSPLEVREKLAGKEQMYINPTAKTDYIDYINYLAKNMFHFGSIQTTKFGVFEEWQDDNPMIYFCPVGFDRTEWVIINQRFVNEYFDNSLTDDELIQQEDQLRNREYVFATPESFCGY